MSDEPEFNINVYRDDVLEKTLPLHSDDGVSYGIP